MKISNNIYSIFIVVTMLMFSACSIDEGENLNGAETSSISEDLSRVELPQVVGGILADMRERLATQVDAISVLGRDYWRHQASDPRWVGDLLVGNVDDNTYYTTQPYAARYAVVKECNLLLEGLENSTADWSEEERAAIRGFANTIKAHELLSVLMLQYQNGVRVDVADPDNLGPFLSFDEGLDAIITMLEEAGADLEFGGEIEPNTMGVSYLEFNRAITARAAAYDGNYQLVLSALEDSFIDLNGDMDAGAYHQYSAAGADVLNLLFFQLNSTAANARIAHPDWIDSAEPGDSRVNKAVLRDAPLTVSDLTGDHDVFIYQSNTAPVGIVRNEELILLYAEASMMLGSSGDAVGAVNAVRSAAGLSNVGSVDLDQLLYERRYSLFAEGHRWIDLRRFDRLNDLVLDRPGDEVVEQFPIPQTENP